jgi:hypothetical protein
MLSYWLDRGHYVISRKLAGSIPDVIIEFYN